MKAQALSAKYMLMYQRALLAGALRAYMLTCQRALRTCVLTCHGAFHAYELTCQRALRAVVLTCQPPLSAYVPHVSTWLSFPTHRLFVHVITCQHALPPQ